MSAIVHSKPLPKRRDNLVRIVIKLENDAFHGDEGGEVARILRELAFRLNGEVRLDNGLNVTLRDSNGNCVGACQAIRPTR